MGFLSTEFLYSTLLCQMHFKYSLLQVSQGNASIYKPHANTAMHAHSATLIHNTHKDTKVHSHSRSHHSLRKRILKVCFTKLGRGGRIFSFSPSYSRCVFERESRAVQARSFHYHSEKALHETLPGKQGRLLVIFLLYYCQNLLYFTFYSWKPFSFEIPIAFAFVFIPFECWDVRGSFALSSYIYLLILKCSTHKSLYLYKKKIPKQTGAAPNVPILFRSNVTECNWNQMLVSMSSESLALDLDMLSKVSQHTQHSSWDGNAPMETLAEQIWL